MNIMTATILLSLFTVAACGDPCLPTFLGDGSLILAPDECLPDGESTLAPVDSSTGDDESTTNDGTGEGVSTGDQPVECHAPGAAYGPCNAGECEAGTMCITANNLSICAPACSEVGSLGGCPADRCGPPSPAVECSADWDMLACLRGCSGVNTGCLDGQMCTAFGCMWPQ
jgi:hypothetical protein